MLLLSPLLDLIDDAVVAEVGMSRERIVLSGLDESTPRLEAEASTRI